MPARIKEPRRKLKVVDINGDEWLVEMARSNYSTTMATFSRTDKSASDRRAHVEAYNGGALMASAPPFAAVVVSPHSQPVSRNYRVVKTAQTGKFYVERGSGYSNHPTDWYESLLPAFLPPVAEQLAEFINLFDTHFASGQAQEARREQKRTKLGGRRVQVETLTVAVNPLYGAARIEELDRNEQLSVFVYPDSGTDTIELQAGLMRDPYFTSAQVLTRRLERGNASMFSKESLGYDPAQMILVQPLAGTETYQSGNGNPKTVGLYARATDIYALLYKIYSEQQNGWTRGTGGHYDAPPNFPFEVKLEELDWKTGEPSSSQDARVEYDGKNRKGEPRVKITPTGRVALAWRKSGTGMRGPKSYTATFEELQDGRIREEGGQLVGKASRRIAPRDRDRILVALDARYERGLKGTGLAGSEWTFRASEDNTQHTNLTEYGGDWPQEQWDEEPRGDGARDDRWQSYSFPLSDLGRIEATPNGTVIHIDNVMVRMPHGTVEGLDRFSDACHTAGSRQVFAMMPPYMAQAEQQLEALRTRPPQRSTNFLDEGEPTADDYRQYWQGVVDGLTRVQEELKRELAAKHQSVDEETPVCFSGDRMVERHEGTHAFLALEYPPPAYHEGDPGNFQSALLVHNTTMRLTIERFLTTAGAATAYFWNDFGNEITPESGRPEEVLTALVAMVDVVRWTDMEAQARETRRVAWGFATYLKPYTVLVDERALELSMVAAARQLAQQYPDEPSLLGAVLGVLRQIRYEREATGARTDPKAERRYPMTQVRTQARTARNILDE